MKLPFRGIEGFIKKPPADVLAVLVYGPDEGLVRERMKALSAAAVPGADDPFSVAEFSGDALLEDPSRLLDEAQSISMLGGRRVVRLRGATDKNAPAVKSALSAMKPGDNFVLVEADSLSPRSALRLLFETAKNAVALPCYIDDARDTGRVISDSLRAAGCRISSDALVHMAACVAGDRAVARGEVEKLLTYMGPDNKNIALEDVTACVGDNASLPLEDLARHVASGQFAEADRVLGTVLSEGAPAVAVLRSLQNHFLKLHAAQARIQQGESMDTAIGHIRPPLFFKLRPAFEAQLAALGLGRLEQALSVIASAEARCKQTGGMPEIMAGRAVLALCLIAGRASAGRRT